MDEAVVRAWFDEYREMFGPLGRGESDDLEALLRYYAVPLVVTTDDAAGARTTASEVVEFVRQQVGAMRAAQYDRTEIIAAQVTTLNDCSLLYRAEIARHRGDGTEVGRLTATYLIADTADGLRISALAIHSP